MAKQNIGDLIIATGGSIIIAGLGVAAFLDYVIHPSGPNQGAAILGTGIGNMFTTLTDQASHNMEFPTVTGG